MLAEIDVQLLAQLAAAATSWLDRPQALALVLHHYLALTAPLGWWRDEWPALWAPPVMAMIAGAPSTSPELAAQ